MRSDFDSATDSRPSPSADNVGSSGRKRAKRKRPRSLSTEGTSSTPGSSEEDEKHRKRKAIRGPGKKTNLRKGKEDQETRRGKRRKYTKEGEKKHAKRHKKDEKQDRKRRKNLLSETDPVAAKSEVSLPSLHRTQLEVVTEAERQRKALVWQNVEMAKARLASGELQRKRDEQMEMQRLYGTVDWREKKKLRSEKRRLERTIATGKRLANIEEREQAKMDAFRVALGLPSAEAQRQAEWRAEATRALAEAEALSKEGVAHCDGSHSRTSRAAIIGPKLPR